MRITLQDGLIYDGSGNLPFYGDIIIEENQILAVSSQAEQAKYETDKVYNCSGLIITPGFVDTHRHCDLAALRDPDFGIIELSQGITSVVSGNCGLTPFPTAPENQEAWYRFLEPCLGKTPPSLKGLSFSRYLEALHHAKLPLNLGSLIGTGAVKHAIKGFADSPYKETEMTQCQALLQAALESGALGISIGVMYPPECYSSPEEFVRLLTAAKPFDSLVSCHIRGEGDALVESVQEMIRICRDAELSLNISHFKSTGIKNWKREIHRAIECIETAQQQGQDISVDFYPYTGGATMLLSLIPPSLLTDTKGNNPEWFASAAAKDAVRKELNRPNSTWESMAALIGWNRILIGSVQHDVNKRYQGQSIHENARRFGFEDEVDFLCTLMAEEQGQVGVILMSMDQEDVDTIAKLPYTSVISDALYGGGDNPHPRLYGSFIRLIRDYVLDRRILSFEEAVRKMSSQPAARYGLAKRGLLKPGNYADITVLNPETLQDYASFENPRQLSAGAELVFVNGCLAWEHNALVPHTGSRVLKGNVKK